MAKSVLHVADFGVEFGKAGLDAAPESAVGLGVIGVGFVVFELGDQGVAASGVVGDLLA